MNYRTTFGGGNGTARYGVEHESRAQARQIEACDIIEDLAVNEAKATQEDKS